MPATDVAAAANARLVTRVEYGIDPRGWRMAHALNARLQRGIAGLDGPRVLPRNATFHGIAQTPQNFTGAAALGMGQGRPVVERSGEMADARSANAESDPAMAVFAARMRRQR